jgi:hypothetical protein
MGGGGVYSFVVLALINSVFLLLEICFAVLDFSISSLAMLIFLVPWSSSSTWMRNLVSASDHTAKTYERYTQAPVHHAYSAERINQEKVVARTEDAEKGTIDNPIEILNPFDKAHLYRLNVSL